MEKQCNFCGNPLHEIRLGSNRARLWVHRGEELDYCTAFKLDRNLIQQLIEVMHRLGKRGPIEMLRDDKGEVVIFGDPEQDPHRAD